MKINNIFLKISIVINVLMIFFGAYIGNLYILQFIALAFAILSLNLKKIKIKSDTILWIILCIILIMSTVYSISRQDSIEVVSLIFMAIILKMLYENEEKEWKKYFLRLTLISSGVHVVATIIQLIFPNLINSLNSIILSPEGLKINQELYKTGGYAGITAQTSINAFYIAIFVGIIFLNLVLKKENKALNTFFLIVSIIALFVTGKRGMLIFSLLSIILIYLYTAFKDKKNILKYVPMFFIIGIIGYISVINIPQAKVVIDKIQTLNEQGNKLNGRDILWKESIEVFKENPIVGIGIGNIQIIIGDYSHNTYIQLLAETGIIGFTMYILATLISLFTTIKKANIILRKEDIKPKINILFSLFIQGIFIMYRIYW